MSGCLEIRLGGRSLRAFLHIIFVNSASYELLIHEAGKILGGIRMDTSRYGVQEPRIDLPRPSPLVMYEYCFVLAPRIRETKVLLRQRDLVNLIVVSFVRRKGKMGVSLFGEH